MATATGTSRGSQLLAAWRADATKAIAAALLDLDEASYGRFENGVRKPSAEIAVRIERLTDHAVTALSWYEPPAKTARAAS